MRRMSDLFLRALAREPVERTPVWFMRQAGRCLPAYRAAREERGFFELVRDPEAAAEIEFDSIGFQLVQSDPTPAPFALNDMIGNVYDGTLDRATEIVRRTLPPGPVLRRRNRRPRRGV